MSTVAGHGLVAQVRGGPSIYFGDATELPRAKWHPATAVLADPSSAGAAYIDVTDPVRPAAGAGGGVDLELSGDFVHDRQLADLQGNSQPQVEPSRGATLASFLRVGRSATNVASGHAR